MSDDILGVRRAELDSLSEAVYHILHGLTPAPVPVPAGAPQDEFQQLCQFLNQLLRDYSILCRTLAALSRGELDFEIPRTRMQAVHSLKHLQANLHHMTWKVQQIAKGDLAQQIDFMGDFSAAFNDMVRQLSEARESLETKNRQLEMASRTDPLTGLWNRRGLMAILRHEVERVARQGSPLCVAMGDIDFFKRVNDTYGHDAGDAVLVKAAHTIQDSLRKSDVCARWGGEEFLLLLTGVRAGDARMAVERLRQSLENVRVPHGDLTIRFTMSLGLVEYGLEESTDECIRRCDALLYHAKQSGRNRVCTTVEDVARQPEEVLAGA